LFFSMTQTVQSQTPLTIDTVTADPDIVCSGSEVKLNVEVSGGTGNYDFAWVSNPGNFTSSEQDPSAAPEVTTTYTVVVNDGVTSEKDKVEVNVTPKPEADAGGDATICEGDTYSFNGVASANYESYVEWTTNGDGTFSSTGTKTPTYTPGEQDEQNESVQLTLYAFPESVCFGVPPASDQMTLNITPRAEADAGTYDDICENEVIELNEATASNYSEIKWSSDDGGTFGNIHRLNTVYSPIGEDTAAGEVELSLTAYSDEACLDSAVSTATINVTPLPEVEAGPNDTICEGDSYGDFNFEEIYTNNHSSRQWSSSGDGTFENPDEIYNAVYHPGSNDIENGEVTLILTATGEGACQEEVSDEMVLTINPPPQVDAGEDVSICQNSSYELQPIVEHSSGVQWSGGNGFDSTTIENAVYTPTEEDIEAGEVTLTITANSLEPCTGSASDEVTLTLEPLPQIDGVNDGNVCDNESYALNADTLYASSVYWSSSGDGTFDDSTKINAIYTPGEMDDQVTLTLTAAPTSPCSDSVQAEMQLTVIEGPSVDAGSDGKICENSTFTPQDASEQNTTSLIWTSSSEGGSFENANSLTPEYTPGDNDIDSGKVYLYLTGQSDNCSSSRDSLLLTIQKEPFADAGEDSTKCVPEGIQPEFELNGTIENSTYFLWTTDGDGSFSSDTVRNPTYSFGPSDIDNQEVTLTLTAYALSPCQNIYEDEVVLSYSGQPTAEAGDGETICEGKTIQLDGTAKHFGTLLWQRIPDDGTGGTFDTATIQDPVYTPSDTDYDNGEIKLILQVFGQGQCGEQTVIDTVVYDVQKKPVPDAGEDIAICESGVVELEGTAENYGGVQWSAPNGSGTFTDENSLVTNYEPSSQDLQKDSLMLFMSAWALLPCDAPVKDTVILTINKNPVADLGPDFTACSGTPIELNAGTDYYSDVEWESSGDGTFTGGQGNKISEYLAGEEDLSNGQVTITATVYPAEACSETVSDQVVITLNESPSIDMPDVVEGQYNASVTFEPSVSGMSGVYKYRWEPDSMFVNPRDKNGETITFSYGESDDNYQFSLTVTDDDNECSTTDSVTVELEAGPPIIEITAEPPNVCNTGQTATELIPKISGGTGNPQNYSYSWTSDDGFTSDEKRPVVSPNQDTEYTLTVEDQSYSSSKSILIEVKENATTPDIEGNSTSREFLSETYTTIGSDEAYYEWSAKNGSVVQGQGSKKATIEWGIAGIGYVYLRKANEYGCFGDTTEMMVNLRTNSINKISTIEDLKIHPNPVKKKLYISFELKESNEVELELYNSMGKIVNQLPSKRELPGYRSYNLSMESYESGLYLLKMRVGDESMIKRILRVK